MGRVDEDVRHNSVFIAKVVFGDPGAVVSKPVGRKERLAMSGYPGGPVAFFQFIDGWRRSGDFEGLEFR